MVKSDFLEEAEAFSAFLQIYAKDRGAIEVRFESI
jgi:hypothetical protein